MRRHRRRHPSPGRTIAAITHLPAAPRRDYVSGMNRLANETSPYLRQHADNPVDWYPWGPEALERAKQEDKPILLSIGYAACHWCHVMERESFEDEETARLMNESFVPVKVDREERPDVDAIYMQATQAMTGHGGWPMTVFLTPDGDPFVAGTYFPPEDRHGMPSFRRVLLAVEWPGDKTNRSSIPLSGRVAAGSRVYVQGQPVEVAPSGEFRAEVKLHDGKQKIAVVTVDPFGRRKSDEADITSDRRLPSVSIESPWKR
jgi:hypothetical protein